MDNPIIMGYLSHLITDSLWNETFYGEKCVKENNKIIGFINKNNELVKTDRLRLRKDKQKDFKAFQYYIYKNYSMKLPEFSVAISNESDRLIPIKYDEQSILLFL